MSFKDVLIVIPARDEEKHIGGLLDQLSYYDANVLVVDDAGSDKTYEISREKDAEVIKNATRLGVTKSIEKAVRFANEKGYHYIVTMDGDGQHLVDDALQIAETVRCYDAVLGSRFDSDISGIPSQKLAANSLGANLSSLVINERCYDASCGLRGFKIDCFPDMSNGLPGYSYPFLMLYSAYRKNRSVKWHHVKAIYDCSQFLYTRRIEIEAMIRAAIPYLSDQRLALENICVFADQHCDFAVRIGEDCYYCFYMSSYDGYVIQCDEYLARFDFGLGSRPILVERI